MLITSSSDSSNKVMQNGFLKFDLVSKISAVFTL